MPDESDKERVDRELIELLNEIRVALPGVQVLFAFLLILPFQQGFADISDADRAVYTVALLASALAAAVLIAPSMYHRLNFRRGKKETMLFDANKLMIVGMIATAIGVTCAVYLVTDVIYGETPALVASSAVAITFAVFWIGLPLLRRGDPEA